MQKVGPTNQSHPNIQGAFAMKSSETTTDTVPHGIARGQNVAYILISS